MSNVISAIKIMRILNNKLIVSPTGDESHLIVKVNDKLSELIENYPEQDFSALESKVQVILDDLQYNSRTILFNKMQDDYQLEIPSYSSEDESLHWDLPEKPVQNCKIGNFNAEVKYKVSTLEREEKLKESAKERKKVEENLFKFLANRDLYSLDTEKLREEILCSKDVVSRDIDPVMIVNSKSFQLLEMFLSNREKYRQERSFHLHRQDNKDFMDEQDECREKNIPIKRKQKDSEAFSFTAVKKTRVELELQESDKKEKTEIPTEEKELFEFPFEWPEKRLGKVHEFIEEYLRALLEGDLTDILEYLKGILSEPVDPQKLVEAMQDVLEEESLDFVMKLWRVLIYESFQSD